MTAPARRALYAASNSYLDDSNGAAVANRAMMEFLARWGHQTEALTGTLLETRQDDNLGAWLTRRGHSFEVMGGGSWTASARGPWVDTPIHYRLTVRGVPVALYPELAASSPESAGGGGGADEFLRLLDEALRRFRPDVLVNFGGDALAQEVRSRARAAGAGVVFTLHNFNYHLIDTFKTVDSVITPSRFAADHYRTSLGLDCTVLPNLIDLDRVRAVGHDPRYVTFVNPSYEKGVYAFARIADELGRRRPDIPLLVVEGRGSERTLADCGPDLRVHGNVSLMGHTHDPRQFWGVTRICLMPSLSRENQPLVAIEAMVNGIPIVGSDRGGLPEALGASGVVLSLPDRLTPVTRLLPTAEEIAPWVETVIQLWDDRERYAEHRRRALAESRRWAPEALEPRYARFFGDFRPGGKPVISVISGSPKARNAVLPPG